MDALKQLRLLLRITRSEAIARRYFVVNGFDGALAMLGLNMGFLVSGEIPVATALSACLGTAIALMMSGLSSAYVSESAERHRDLRKLEEAMIADLSESAHAQAARWVPVVIAGVNGLAPFSMALVIVSPLAMASAGWTLPADPLHLSIGFAFVVIGLLGVFLGRVSGLFWLWSMLRTLLIAAITAGLILLLKVG
jgi:predicted membrane protein (TIGR00267 family)